MLWLWRWLTFCTILWCYNLYIKFIYILSSQIKNYASSYVIQNKNDLKIKKNFTFICFGYDGGDYNKFVWSI